MERAQGRPESQFPPRLGAAESTKAKTFTTSATRHGIVVWQEFIYACGKYPLDDEHFFRGCAAGSHLPRFAGWPRPGPSLIAWCGNNEIDMFDGSLNLRTRDDPYGLRVLSFHLARLMRGKIGPLRIQPVRRAPPTTSRPTRTISAISIAWSIEFHNIDFYQYAR